MHRTGRQAIVMTILALGTSSACATKSFVTESVDKRVTEVEERVSGVEQSLEGTASGTRRNSARIVEVDQTASTALEEATSAGQSASDAQDTASSALQKTRALEAINRQLLFEVVIAEGHDQFRFADAQLPEAARASLDMLVQRVSAHPTGVHLEIEGHTDGTGPTEFNQRLGLERAESVRLYLHEHHGLPLHKINVISYGEAKPIAPNDTTDGRAKNRRVVVRVLGSAEPSPAERVTLSTTES